MINAGRPKDVGSKKVAVSQWNDRIPLEKRVGRKCPLSRFFNMAGGQSQSLGAQTGPLRAWTVDWLQIALGNNYFVKKHAWRECY
jgi:hypothetical protein